MGSLIGLSFYSHKLIKRVKKAEALKDHFVSTVSHELRTPLTSIIGSLDIIKSGMAGEISEESKKIVGIAYRNSNRLLDLINDILDLQKLESRSYDLPDRADAHSALCGRCRRGDGRFCRSVQSHDQGGD